VGVDPGEVVGYPDWPCLLGGGRVPVGHRRWLVVGLVRGWEVTEVWLIWVGFYRQFMHLGGV